jgi:AcrR family transcriptional regulator
LRRRPARYHHGDLRRALLDAVLELVVELGGTGGVTLREAARRAGVSHNAPYRHFDDKGAVLAAIATEGFAELSRRLSAARAGVAEDAERFVQTGMAYLAFARERPGHLAVMFGPELAKSRTPELQEAANQTFQLLKELATDAGAPAGAEARRLGVVAWSFLHGLALLAGDRQVPASVAATPETLALEGLQRLFDGFRANRTR